MTAHAPFAHFTPTTAAETALARIALQAHADAFQAATGVVVFIDGPIDADGWAPFHIEISPTGDLFDAVRLTGHAALSEGFELYPIFRAEGVTAGPIPATDCGLWMLMGGWFELNGWAFPAHGFSQLRQLMIAPVR